MNKTTLLNTFACAVHRHPDTLFIDGECQLTYGDAARHVSRRAHQLRAASHGFPVILSGPNTAVWVLSFLAARAADLMVVPLSEETTEDQWQAISQLIGPSYRMDTARDAGVLVNSDAIPRPLPSRAGICLPTSGSTGQPRCALRSETSLLEEGERYLQGFNLTPDEPHSHGSAPLSCICPRGHARCCRRRWVYARPDPPFSAASGAAAAAGGSSFAVATRTDYGSAAVRGV